MVAARDPDPGLKGQVTYRLLETIGVRALRLVDLTPGELHARRCFDRGELAELQLGLEALDGGSPLRRAGAEPWCGCMWRTRRLRTSAGHTANSSVAQPSCLFPREGPWGQTKASAPS